MERIPTGRPKLTPEEYQSCEGLPLFDTAWNEQEEKKAREWKADRQEALEIAMTNGFQRSRKCGPKKPGVGYEPRTAPGPRYFFPGEDASD